MKSKQSIYGQNQFLWTHRSSFEGETEVQQKVPLLSKTFIDTNSLFKRINYLADRKSRKFRNSSVGRQTKRDSPSSFVPWMQLSKTQKDFQLSDHLSYEGSFKGAYMSEIPKFNEETLYNSPLYETNPLFMISNINPLEPKFTGMKNK